MELVMNILNERITKYKALSIIFAFLRSFSKFLGFSAPAIFYLYFLGVNFFLCIGIAIFYIALMRIVWVQFDAKSRVYKSVYQKTEGQKEDILKESFK